MRLLRLGTLNLKAWQQQKSDKQAAGKRLNENSIPSPALLLELFNTARQVLTYLVKIASDTEQAECVQVRLEFCPTLLYEYGLAFLEECTAFYYSNSDAPSELLMKTVEDLTKRRYTLRWAHVWS